MAKKTTAVVNEQTREIKFINKDITSSGCVELRLRGKEAFLQSEEGTIRIGINNNGKLYVHAVETRVVEPEKVL